MNDKQLVSLIKTVECGSFCKAEESIYLSRQAIRKHINSLEEELGFPLLVRTHQGISLTQAGTEFYHSAKKMLTDMDFTIKKCLALNLNEQIIRIKNPYHPHPLLEKVMIEFSERFPEVKQQVIMQLKPQKSADIIDDILGGRIDLAECPYESAIEDCSDVQYREFVPLPLKCIVAPNHPLAGNKTICLDELSGRSVCMSWKYAELLSLMNERCHGFSLEILHGSIMQAIVNVCYNGGIFISRAYFLNSVPPLITIPLDVDITYLSIIAYRKQPSFIVSEFLRVVDDLYPLPCS